LSWGSQSEDGVLNSGNLLALFSSNGILENDRRIASVVSKLKKLGGLRKEIELEPDRFFHIIHGVRTYRHQIHGITKIPFDSKILIFGINFFTSRVLIVFLILESAYICKFFKLC
jgi:hypothetical protein